VVENDVEEVVQVVNFE
jgi:hypothetical protein